MHAGNACVVRACMRVQIHTKMISHPHYTTSLPTPFINMLTPQMPLASTLQNLLQNLMFKIKNIFQHKVLHLTRIRKLADLDN